MDEAETLVRILELIGRHALDCAREIRALRTQVGEPAATREEESARDDRPSDLDG